MVRKITLLVCVLSLIFGFAVTAKAATHTIYDGNISSTYVSYFRDIVTGIGFNDNYIAVRTGQYEHILVVGKLEKNGNTVKSLEPVTIYSIDNQSNNYNSHYKYTVTTSNNFEVNLDDNIVYTDLGDYPELIDRGDKYEMLSAVLIAVFMLGIVIKQFFANR